MPAPSAEQMSDALLSLQQQVATMGVQLSADRMACALQRWIQHDRLSFVDTRGMGKLSMLTALQKTRIDGRSKLEQDEIETILTTSECRRLQAELGLRTLKEHNH